MDTNIAPTASCDVVAAMFEDCAAARAAHDRLVAAGINRSAIEMVEQDRARDPAGHGVWNAITDKSVPHEHAHGYAEGVERGHAMLFVRESADQQAQVMRLLEAEHPVDIMTRVQDWTGQGWSGVHRSQAAPADKPQLHFTDRPLSDHQHSTGLLNDTDVAQPIGGPLLNPMGIPVAGIRTTGSNRVRRYEAADIL